MSRLYLVRHDLHSGSRTRVAPLSEQGRLDALRVADLFALLLKGLHSTFGFEFWKGMAFPDIYELRFQDATLGGVRRLWRGAGDGLDETT
jgi:hypothetical protein